MVATGVMGIGCLLHATALGILLVWSVLQLQNISASCPQCNENAACYNSSHCICKDGFWAKPDNRKIIEPHVRCEGKEACLHLLPTIVINTLGHPREERVSYSLHF
ncbi:Adhesion G protein-coupled receptor E4, partial [Lemmus lemmus]